MSLLRKDIIALDIQDKYVRCVQLRYQAHSWRVQKTALKEIPLPDGDESASQNIFAAHSIKSLLQEMNLYPPKNLVTSICGRDSSIKILDLPPVEGRDLKEIENMVIYELMMNLPVNIEQMGYDYQIVKQDEYGTKIFTAAAKRNVIQRHLKLLDMAGVYPDVVTTSPLMLFNMFASINPDYMEFGEVGLVCLQDSVGNVVVCEDGNLVYARSFALQGDKDQLIREIRSSFETYLKARSDKSKDQEDDIAALLNNFVYHLVTDDGELPSDFSEHDLTQIAPDAQWKLHSAGDDLVYGMAMSAARLPHQSISPIKINLLKQISHERELTERKAVWAKVEKMVPAIAFIVMLTISGILWWQVTQADKDLSFLNKARQTNSQQLELISRLKETEKELMERIKSPNVVTDSTSMISYQLSQIATTLPEII